MSDEEDLTFLAEDAARWAPDGSPPLVRRDSAVVDGRVVSALIWGTETPATVYLHGAGLNAHAWDPVVLARNRSAIALDLPGHGHSDWREDRDYSPRLLASTVIDVVDALGLDSFDLVGHSLGGLVALEVAAAAPDRVQTAAIVDTTPGPTSKVSAAGSFFAGPSSYASRDELIARALEHGLGADPLELVRGITLNTRVRADGRVELRHHFAHGGAEGFVGSLDRDGLWSRTERLRQPLLLAAGVRGNLSPENVIEFVERASRARFVWLDAGHNVQRDVPRELAAELNRFADDNRS